MDPVEGRPVGKRAVFRRDLHSFAPEIPRNRLTRDPAATLIRLDSMALAEFLDFAGRCLGCATYAEVERSRS